MRLAVILASLGGGGMERMRIHLVKEWARQGIEVDLVLSGANGPLRDQVPAEVQVFEVASRHPALFPFGLRRYLNSRRPTHLLSAGNDINALTLLVASRLRTQIPIVVSVHNHLSSELALTKGLKRIEALAVAWVLTRVIQRARGVIAVSEGVGEDLKAHIPLRNGQLHVIYNPVVTAETRERLAASLSDCPVPTGTPWILFVGRFVHQKGLDVLMDALKRIKDRTRAHLVLMGEGPLKSEMVSKVAALGLSDRVHLVGFQSNPLPWMRETNVVVLPSRHEGLGNVLIEAMACGTQIVASDCPSGPAEILVHGRYGQLVPVDDADSLAEALLRSLDGRFRVPPRILKARAAVFSSERVALAYQSVLEDSNKAPDDAPREIRV